MAVILALVNKGFKFSNIKSIFENYSIGEKYRQHSAKDNYLKYNTEKAKEFSNLTGSEMQDPLFISGAMQSDSGKYSLKIVRFQEYMNKKHRLKFLEKERVFFLYTGTSYEQCSEDRLNFICQNELGDHRELFSKTALSNFIHYSIADILIDADKAYEDQVQYYRLNSGTRHAEMLSSPVLRMTSSSDSSIGPKQSDCSTNYASAFCQSVQWLWWKTLKRRSQKHNMTWRRMEYLCVKWLPPVRVYHPYPLVRFGVIT
jgi:hypothetical protein